MRTVTKLGVAAAALLLSTAPMAMAGQITQTDSFGPASSITNHTFNFAGYTGAGTLTNVAITVTESISGGETATNTGSANITGTMGVKDFSSVSSTRFSTVNLTNPSNTIAATLTKAGTPGDTTGFRPLSGTVSDTFNFLSGLTHFTTAWSALGNDTSAIVANFSPDTVDLSLGTDGTLSVSAVYTYTGGAVVSEPFSIAMLASGLLGLGIIRRRRSR